METHGKPIKAEQIHALQARLLALCLHDRVFNIGQDVFLLQRNYRYVEQMVRLEQSLWNYAIA